MNQLNFEHYDYTGLARLWGKASLASFSVKKQRKKVAQMFVVGIFMDPLAKAFYYINYGLSIITSNVCQISVDFQFFVSSQ